MKQNKRRSANRARRRLKFAMAAGALLALVLAGGAWARVQDTEEKTSAPMSDTQADVAKWGLVAAAVAFGLGAVGAGVAIAHVGAAAMGVIGEKPELAGQALIFIALAEGLVVFGFITALMILGKV